MGLDISIVTKWGEPVGAVDDNFEDEEGNSVFGEGAISWNTPEYFSRGSGLPKGPVIAAEEADGFRAGSYGGYNMWRNDLAKLAGYPEETIPADRFSPPYTGHAVGAWNSDSGPFWELINFSDCEGFIGPKVCQKLLVDFDAWSAKVSEHGAHHPRFAELFDKFHAGIREAATSNGAVWFH